MIHHARIAQRVQHAIDGGTFQGTGISFRVADTSSQQSDPVVLISTAPDADAMLEQKGVTVTLVHAGAHKTDANPYEPLPPDVRDRMQVELEGLRTLFAQTVAAGRGNRLDVHAALDTEAAVLRGAAAVAAGLADAVADPRSAFLTFAESIHHNANPSLRGTKPAILSKPRKETSMNATTDPTDETDIRAEAAEVAQVCAQAARLGVQIDAADAVKRGLKPKALRAQVLEDLAARGDAAGIVASAPAAAAKDSPLIAAAKKAANAAH